jgi:hypothetical protein
LSSLFFLVWLSPKGFSPSAQAAMPERASKRVIRKREEAVFPFCFSATNGCIMEELFIDLHRKTIK